MDLWAMAVHDLRLSSTDFWRTTPRMIAALAERWREDQARRDCRAGLIAAIIANVHRRRGTKSFEPSTFFPHLRPVKRAQTQSEMIAILEAIGQARAKRSK